MPSDSQCGCCVLGLAGVVFQISGTNTRARLPKHAFLSTVYFQLHLSTFTFLQVNFTNGGISCTPSLPNGSSYSYHHDPIMSLSCFSAFSPPSLFDTPSAINRSGPQRLRSQYYCNNCFSIFSASRHLLVTGVSRPVLQGLALTINFLELYK